MDLVGGLTSIVPASDAAAKRTGLRETVVGGEDRRGAVTGTRALMLAVLEDGLKAFLSRSRLLAAEAECWVFSPSRRSPFSFLVLCDAFDLDPDALRKRLVQLRAQGASSRHLIPRVRRNVRSVSRVRLSRRRRRRH
jgi:hypothetical protein